MLTLFISYCVLAMIGWVVFVFAYFPKYMRFSMLFVTPLAPLLFPIIGAAKLYRLLTH